LRDLENGHERGLSFDLARADHALQFFPTVLRLNGGQFEGIPFDLHPAQAFIIGSLFGWIRKDGTRRFRVAYIEQGKGNGKSPLVAGIGLYGMIADKEPRAEVYAAATKKDQAMIMFRDAVSMAEQSPALSRRLKKSGRDDKVWNLYDEKTNSFFRPISADDGQSGPRPHIGLIDELHEHKSATVINMMSAGRKWRRQPLIVAITNSGTDRKSVCWEYRQKGIEVASGIKDDDTLFPYICALDEGEDPFKDECCWIKANPLLGSIIDPQYLRDEVKAAAGMPSKESDVRRLNFCEWTEAHNPAVGYALWQAARAEYTLEKFRGMKAVAGIDLSATTDLTSVVLDFLIDGTHWLWPLFWIPEEGLSDRVKKDGVPYDIWLKAGHVLSTPGAAIDKDFVVDHLAKMLGKYDISLVAAPFDRHRIDVLKAACDRVGVTWPLEQFGQGFVSMGPAWDAVETALVKGKFKHPGNPCLDGNAANAVIVSDPAGNRKLDKSKATGRIDGMVAATMAVGWHENNRPPEPKKYQMLIY
jgi:phage terminase large subunit-like protein